MKKGRGALWCLLIPIDQHVKFLAGERKYCEEEEVAFHKAVYNSGQEQTALVPSTPFMIEECRTAVLNKREEYLLYYLEHELV